MPKSPLNMNQPGAPANPVPQVFAQIARKIVASAMRQKLASTPPIFVAVRWPHMAEMANSSAVRKAAIIKPSNESGRTAGGVRNLAERMSGYNPS